jgi:hypothetical protein
MEAWKDVVGEMVGDTIQEKPEYLAGLALITDGESGRGKRLAFYPAAGLPMDIKKRMATLFAHRAVWSREQIAPYLMALESGPVTVDKILFKHARRFAGAKGEKLYNKR